MPARRRRQRDDRREAARLDPAVVHHWAQCILAPHRGEFHRNELHSLVSRRVTRMMRNVLAGAAAVGVIVRGLSSDASLTSAAAPTAAQTAKAACPSLQVDPLWPKPLPNHWLLGSVTGVAVDAQDHIWVVHRGYDSLTARTEIGAATTPPTADECCVPAPPVLEFDHGGQPREPLGRTGSRYDWPRSPGGIAVDAKGNVWITAAGGRPQSRSARADAAGARALRRRPEDAHVLKFSRTGEFLLQIGQAGTPGGNDSKTGLNRPAGVDVDAAANEVYVADGFGNRRVVVFDADDRRLQAALGRLRRGPGRRRRGAVQSGRATGEAVPHA